MGLALLGMMVVIGVALIVALVHFTAPADAVGLAGTDAAREIFARDYPDAATTDAVITEDGRSAVLALRGGGAGLVHRFGDRYLTRDLSAGAFAADCEGRVLALRLFEPGWAGVRFVFADDEAARRAAAMVATSDHQRGAA